MNRSTGIVIAIAVLVLYVGPAGRVSAQQDDQKGETRALAQTAIDLIEAGRPAQAKEALRLPEQPLLALGASNILIRHYYWKKQDLAVVTDFAGDAITFGRALVREGGNAEMRRLILESVLAIAYNLASFTWPGWGQEGIVITREQREQGARAADLNLRLGELLSNDPKSLSSAHWIVGAHQLTAGRPEDAVASFRRAKKRSAEAGDPIGGSLNQGFIGIAFALSGRRKEGLAIARQAVAALEAAGSEDADYFADQVREVFARLVEGSASAAPRLLRVECGPVLLRLPPEDTAVLFHIVDQLSGWSPRCHPRYRKVMKLAAGEEAALARYARIRQRAGSDLPTFLYTRASIDDALFAAAEQGVLEPPEVLSLRAALTMLTPRINRLRAEYRDVRGVFLEALKAEDLAKAAGSFAKFTGVDSLALEVYPVPSPGPEVGVTRGEGVVVLELPRGRDATKVMLHEIAVALLGKRLELLAATAEETPGLSVEALTESIAAAFAEGQNSDEGDLAEALRAPLGDALESGTFEEFLSRVGPLWQIHLDRAAEEKGK